MELKPVEELGYQEFIDREMIKCPECGFLAPPRQIKNIGEMCERCYIEDGKKVIKGEKLNPEHNLVDRYKLNTGEI